MKVFVLSEQISGLFVYFLFNVSTFWTQMFVFISNWPNALCNMLSCLFVVVYWIASKQVCVEIQNRRQKTRPLRVVPGTSPHRLAASNMLELPVRSCVSVLHVFWMIDRSTAFCHLQSVSLMSLWAAFSLGLSFVTWRINTNIPSAVWTVSRLLLLSVHVG